MTKWRQGLVWYGPKWAREKNLPPVRTRLLRITGKKADVWLLTDVLESRPLSKATVAAAPARTGLVRSL